MAKSDFQRASELSTPGSSEPAPRTLSDNLIEAVEQVELTLVQNLHGVRRAARARKIV